MSIIGQPARAFHCLRDAFGLCAVFCISGHVLNTHLGQTVAMQEQVSVEETKGSAALGAEV